MNQEIIQKQKKFPASFWAANTIELFERAAFYATASFVVIYFHEILGMSPTFSTFLNGSLLWGLIYFLPILSGTLADKFGFRRSLSVSFIILSLGYFILGNVQNIWPKIIGAKAATAIDYSIPVILGILLIGIGGSIVKPCIAGTIQKTSGTRATLGFGIFYMVINIGSISGRGVSYFIRTNFGIPAIFTYAATVFALIGLIIVVFIYREPEYVSDGKKDDQVENKKTLGQAIAGIFYVLKNIKFVFFLIVIGLFWFIYVQIYNLIPLFLRFIDPTAPVEIYTLANPIMIVTFQLIMTKLTKKWTPIKSILIGVIITTIGMLINIIPILLFTDIAKKVTLLEIMIPLAGIFMILSLAAMAVGEMMLSPRMFEYIGAIAPKGEEGLYLGYANLPIAIGTIVGSPIGGALFEYFISTPHKNGEPINPIATWLIVGCMGIISMIGLVIYDKFLVKERES
ncbi:MAG: MFS transporter [Candidatus Aminicenantes bacterium]|nr:MFS transporter [Candidatus Aminicenantes bacterium]